MSAFIYDKFDKVKAKINLLKNYLCLLSWNSIRNHNCFILGCLSNFIDLFYTPLNSQYRVYHILEFFQLKNPN